MWTELKFMENVWQLQTEFQLTIKSVPPICYDLENKFEALVCLY